MTPGWRPTVPRAIRGPAAHLQYWWQLHPRAGLALRTSVAGGAAWALAQWLPGSEGNHYAYFAPMGAVVVSSTSVVGSAKELLRSVAALAMGAGLGLAALAVVEPNALTVAVVIGISILLAGFRGLGTMRGWVPTVAILTMVLGRDAPLTYVTAYTGLSALGAATAVVVVTAVPQLITAPLDESVTRLWKLIIDRLQQISDDLEADGVVDPAADQEIDRARRAVDDHVMTAVERMRANRRHRRMSADGRLDRARSVRHLAFRLQESERALEDLDLSRADGDHNVLNDTLVEAVQLVHRSLRRGRVDDLDDELDSVLGRLDTQVDAVTAPAPGRHTAATLVYNIRRLGLAAQDAIKVAVPDDDNSGDG